MVPPGTELQLVSPTAVSKSSNQVPDEPVKSVPRLKERWILKNMCGGSLSLAPTGQKVTTISSGQEVTTPTGQKVTTPTGQKNTRKVASPTKQEVSSPTMQKVASPSKQKVVSPLKQKLTIPTNRFMLEGPAAKMARVMGTDVSTEVWLLNESIKKTNEWETGKVW